MCTHYWRIEPPDGPTSRAVCIICGDECDMLNAIPGLVETEAYRSTVRLSLSRYLNKRFTADDILAFYR